MALTLMSKLNSKKDVPVDSTESIVASMRKTKITSCGCKTKPCSCEKTNTLDRHSIEFHKTAMSPSPNLAYLLALQSLAQTNYNSLEYPKFITPFGSVADSPKIPQILLGRQIDLPLSLTKRNRSSNGDKNSEEKKYQCNHCGDSFGYKHVLQNHVRTHTGEKPFVCLDPECNKRFTRDHHLKTHMRLHTGEKPFECKYCDKKFVQVANLRRHMRVHTGERPYVCNFESCQMRFSDSNQLNVHVLTHKESVPPVVVPPVMVMNNPIDLIRSFHFPGPLYFPTLPFYPYMVHHDFQEKPEDLSLKSSRLISS